MTNTGQPSLPGRTLPSGPQGLPPAQGLYDPANEHDACGVGFVVDLKNRKSHDLVRKAIQILLNLEHRGACGCETNTGDGAGILSRCRTASCAKVRPRPGIRLPRPGDYGVGMVFLPTDPTDRGALRGDVRAHRPRRGAEGPRLARRAGRQLADRADAPARRAGDSAALHRPGQRPARPTSRKIAPRRSSASSTSSASCVENAVRRSNLPQRDMFYIPSLSSQDARSTRGCSTPTRLAPFLPRPAATRPWRRPWPWSIRASAPTPSRTGRGRIRTATSPTTARSTRCAATSTGCTARAEPVRLASCSARTSKKLLPIIDQTRQRFGHVRQRPGVAGPDGPVACRTRS